nr:unnamed protein product [Callosobruchus chinensis]
MYVSKKVSV